MNIPVLIVAIITLVAFLAHLFGGTRETAAIAPAPTPNSKLTAHWVQAMGAFQMLSVDLLAMALLLFAIVFWHLGPGEPLITKLASLLYLAWGIVWIVQVLWLKAPSVGLFRLPHWVVWFLCAGLLFYGS